MIRRALSQCVLSLVNTDAFSSVLRSLEGSDTQRNLLRVLTYHRVDRPEEHPDLYYGVHSATPEQFELQLEFLSRRCAFVSLDDVIESIQGGRPLPPRAVLFTFDDAYQGFDDHAWPLLKRYRAPVVMFVPTGFPDQPTLGFWWDQVYHAITTTQQPALDIGEGRWMLDTSVNKKIAAQRTMTLIKSLPHGQAMALVRSISDQLGVSSACHNVISWRRLEVLAAEGVTMGAHTHSHPLLNRLPLDAAKKEVIRSRRELQERLNAPIRSFAFPAGDCSNELAEMLRKEKFELAFTTRRGINNLRNCDPLRLKRINVGGRSTPNVLRLQMLAYAKHLLR